MQGIYSTILTILLLVILVWSLLVDNIEKTHSKSKLKRYFAIILSVIVVFGPALLIVGPIEYYSDIEEYEAETIVVHYAGCKEAIKRFSSDFFICFSDHEAMQVSYNDSVQNEIKEISIGSELIIQINPRCNFLMSICYGNKTIISFNDGLEGLGRQRKVWPIVGSLMYLFVAFACFVSDKGKQTIKRIGRNIIGRHPERYSKRTIDKYFNEKKAKVSDERMAELWQMPWEELVNAMYDRDIDKLNGKPVMLVYNKERDRRFAVLKDKKCYSYVFQRLCKNEKDDWFSINAVEGEFPAAWECANEQGQHDSYKSAEEALQALKEEEEYYKFYQ